MCSSCSRYSILLINLLTHHNIPIPRSMDVVWLISRAEVLETSALSCGTELVHVVGEERGFMAGAGDGDVAETGVEQVRVDAGTSCGMSGSLLPRSSNWYQ